MLKRLCLGISLLSLVSLSNAAPRGVWVKQFGTKESDYTQSVTVDAKGNIYVVGGTNGTLPGQKSAGYTDAFIRKYDPNGKEVWTRQFGTDGTDYAYSVALDTNGNIYVAGYADETLPSQNSRSEGNVFLRKYNANGKEVWTRQFAGSNFYDMNSVALDPKGNIYVAGSTYDTLPGQESPGAHDAFIRKYDPNGKELWTRQFGSTDSDGANSVATDSKGNVYVSGVADGVLPDQESMGSADAFVKKYDPNGKELWTRQFGTRDVDSAESVAADAQGNIYVAGRVRGRQALPGQKSFGKLDAFVRKYDANGNELWTDQFGAGNPTSAYAVVLDTKGNIYVAGSAEGVLPSQKSFGEGGAFIRKYDATGKELWTQQFGTDYDDSANSVVLDTKGNIYVFGNVVSEFPGQKYLGELDAFLYKWAP